MEKVFSIEESLKFGWEKTKAHSLILFQVLITIIAVNFAFSFAFDRFDETPLGFFVWVVSTVAMITLETGFALIVLKLVRSQAAAYKEIIPSFDLVWRAILSSALTALFVLGGFLLLIIPGIYIALRLSMVNFAVIDGAKVMESLRQSGRLTDGHKWHLLGFFVVMTLINIVGFLFLIVGLLVTIPVTMLAYAHIYQKLKEKVPAEAPMELMPEHTHEGHDHSHEGHTHA